MNLPAMDQHPVPQNISSYEFRLVGDMTLKQFLQLAGGVVIALIIFRLPLPGFIKWPLIILSAGAGALVAFVPIQGRPFNQWIMAFIRAIYAPTEYYWNPEATPMAPVTPTGVIQPAVLPPTPLVNPNYSPPAPVIPPVAPPIQKPTTTDFVTAVPAPPKPPPPPPPAIPISRPAPLSQTTPPPSPTPVPAPAPATAVNLTPIVPRTSSTPASAQANITPDLPSPPAPNLLVGLIASAQDQPIDAAIVEIIDQASNLPVRALRTNRLGQFQIATPLSAGTYVIKVEKDLLSFDPVSVAAVGKIISPIIIKAKA